MNELIAEIRSRFAASWDNAQRPDLHQVQLPAKQAVVALAWLKSKTPFVQLNHYSVVDWPEDDEFQLTYLLTDPQGRRSLMLITRIDREQATAESIADLWPQAVTYEQEMNEMFGINFPGSPRMGVPFVLEGWQDKPPMRRDFDTLEYVNRAFPEERYGRKTTHSRPYIGEKAGEKGYL